MRRQCLPRALLAAGAALGCTLLLSSCSDSDNVTMHGSVGMYYGGGYYDPWYYNRGYGPPVVGVRPPSYSRPRPEHPIARPPAPPPPRPMPLPARPAPMPSRR